MCGINQISVFTGPFDDQNVDSSQMNMLIIINISTLRRASQIIVTNVIDYNILVVESY